MNKEELLNLFVKSLNHRILNKQISKEEATEQLNNAIDDFAANIVSTNFNKETIEFMKQNTLAEFAASTVEQLELPSLLLELVENDYETEDDAIEALRTLEVNGEAIPDEIIVGLFSGEVIPTPEELDVICSLFPTAANSDNYVLLQTARHNDYNTLSDEPEDWNDVVETLEALYATNDEVDEEDEDEDEETELEEETEVANYSANEKVIAEFEAMKVNTALSKALRKQEQRAINLLNDERILPSEFNAVIGKIATLDDEDDKLNYFKQWSKKSYSSFGSSGLASFNEYQQQLAQLASIEFCLDVFSERPALPMFSKAVKEETAEYAAFSQPEEGNVDALVQMIEKKWNS